MQAFRLVAALALVGLIISVLFVGGSPTGTSPRRSPLSHLVKRERRLAGGADALERLASRRVRLDLVGASSSSGPRRP